MGKEFLMKIMNKLYQIQAEKSKTFDFVLAFKLNAAYSFTPL
jgi:hypothetical protein